MTANVRIEGRGGYAATLPLREGLGLQALAVRDKSTPLEFDCKKADCGICIVRVVEGAENLTPKTTAEADFLKAMHADPDERLACQCRVMGDVTIRVEAH